MAGKRRKPSLDANQVAFSIAQAVAGGGERVKNPAAVALGKLGGLKGGPARAVALSKRRRSEIAKKAAAARWAKRHKLGQEPSS